MKSDSTLEILKQEIEIYAANNINKKADNPLTYLASVGIAKMTAIVSEANRTNKTIVFSYDKRKLVWKFN